MNILRGCLLASLYALEGCYLLGALNRNLEAIHFKHNASLPSVDEKIRAELQPFFAKWEIREDLIIQETPELPHSKGVNSFTNRGDAVVFTLNNLCNVDKDACMFTIKREIHNIKADGNLELGYFLSYIFQRTLPPMLSFHPFIFYATTFYIKSDEMVHDNYATGKSSIEELKGGRRFLIAVKQYKNEMQEKKSLNDIFRSWCSIEDVMESIHDAVRPISMLDVRIKKIEMNIKRRNGRIDEKVENKKIKQIKNLINNLNPNTLPPSLR